jgi:hypothetical protein
LREFKKYDIRMVSNAVMFTQSFMIIGHLVPKLKRVNKPGALKTLLSLRNESRLKFLADI